MSRSTTETNVGNYEVGGSGRRRFQNNDGNNAIMCPTEMLREFGAGTGLRWGGVIPKIGPNREDWKL